MPAQHFKWGAAVSGGRRHTDDRQEVRHARNQGFLRWTSEIEKRGSFERASMRCHLNQERVRLYTRKHGIRFQTSKLKPRFGDSCAKTEKYWVLADQAAEMQSSIWTGLMTSDVVVHSRLAAACRVQRVGGSVTFTRRPPPAEVGG